MGNLAKRAALSILGLAVVLGYWTIRDRFGGGSTSTPTSSTIPSRVWEGGAGTVSIDVESSDPATLRAYFASMGKSDAGKADRELQAWEKVNAGVHTWTIDVPARTTGTLEFEAVGPKPGSKLSWTIRAGDKQIAQQTETLEKPLQNNEAFFLQIEVDDFATGKLEGEE